MWARLRDTHPGTPTIHLPQYVIALDELPPLLAHETARRQRRQVHGGMAEYVDQGVWRYFAFVSVLGRLRILGKNW